jgi:hypothetical protein
MRRSRLLRFDPFKPGHDITAARLGQTQNRSHIPSLFQFVIAIFHTTSMDNSAMHRIVIAS